MVTTPDRNTLAVFLIFSVMVHPGLIGRGQKRLDGGLVARGVALDFAAIADALVGLDMRAGGHLLQENFDRFRAFGAFKGEDSGGFQHGGSVRGRKRHFIIGGNSHPGVKSDINASVRYTKQAGATTTWGQV